MGRGERVQGAVRERAGEQLVEVADDREPTRGRREAGEAVDDGRSLGSDTSS